MTETMTSEVSTSVDAKITCHIDGARVHIIQTHIKENHPEWTIDRYKEEFPDAPLLSPYAAKLLEERQAKQQQEQAQAQAKANVAAATETGPATIRMKAALFHEVFDLGEAPAARNAKGDPINVTILENHDDTSLLYLPAVDKDYVFNIDLLKKVMLGFQLGMNVYLWGYHGTGKTTVLQQAAARTRRPFIRVQHTLNMQESDVLGTYIAKDGQTPFQLGPLPMAMLNGWVYCADEYDFAMPAITALYQPVLEGEPLIIKEAPPQFRQITPHPNFRFVATGNTNGTGDETGLYQGTNIGNAANYSRFHITEEVEYMDAAIEQSILVSKTAISKSDAAKIVRFAKSVREAYGEGKITMTISPRELISAARLGIAFGGKWLAGLELAFANRCSRIDKKVVMDFGQRIFS